MRKFDLNWFGTLTIDNLGDVVNLFKKLLTDKQYTSVSAHENSGFVPEVRTGQSLKRGCGEISPFVIYYDEKDGRFAGFNFSDSYGVWSVSTNIKDESKITTDDKGPYIRFGENKVTLTFKSGSGQIIHWVFAVEEK